MLGVDRINTFKDKVIFIAGIGGVGGTVLEALARSGFAHFIIVDFDVVDVTNLNRQVLFTNKDVGVKKIEAATKRLKDINPGIVVEGIAKKIDLQFFDNFNEKVDFIVDAIDFVPGKIAIIKYALESNVMFISSLGMGNRLDPNKVIITKLNKTEGDPLARSVRYKCKQQGLDLSKINVVFSTEQPIIKSKTPGSMMAVPSTAGLQIAKYIIEKI